MGLDFRIDNTPRFFYREDSSAAWEEISKYKFGTLAEDAAYMTDDSFELRVEAVERVTSDGASPRWPYSAFGRFRERLAAHIGIELGRMWGFGPGHFDRDSPQWKDWEANSVQWKDLPGGLATHPLIPLLNHSDCDGELSPEQCGQIAPALREIVGAWDDDDYDKQPALALADMMDACAQHGRDLIF